MKTKFGEISCEKITSYHLNWYDVNRDGKISLSEVARKYLGIPKLTLLSDNDTTYDFRVKKEVFDEEEMEDHKESIENMVKTSTVENYELVTLMTDLCLNDVIPEGDYIVHVSW
jgi:hypothetical protein